MCKDCKSASPAFKFCPYCGTKLYSSRILYDSPAFRDLNGHPTNNPDESWYNRDHMREHFLSQNPPVQYTILQIFYSLKAKFNSNVFCESEYVISDSLTCDNTDIITIAFQDLFACGLIENVGKDGDKLLYKIFPQNMIVAQSYIVKAITQLQEERSYVVDTIRKINDQITAFQSLTN